MTTKSTDSEYEIKQLGSYLQDLGRYMIENPHMIEKAEILYNPEVHRSYISYKNKGTIEFKIVTL